MLEDKFVSIEYAFGSFYNPSLPGSPTLSSTIEVLGDFYGGA